MGTFFFLNVGFDEAIQGSLDSKRIFGVSCLRRPKLRPWVIW